MPANPELHAALRSVCLRIGKCRPLTFHNYLLLVWLHLGELGERE